MNSVLKAIDYLVTGPRAVGLNVGLMVLMVGLALTYPVNFGVFNWFVAGWAAMAALLAVRGQHWYEMIRQQALRDFTPEECARIDAMAEQVRHAVEREITAMGGEIVRDEAQPEDSFPKWTQ